MFSDFPNLHPLVVHFPIVLILLGAVLQGVLMFKDSPQLRWGTLIIMGAAFASALVASKVFHAHAAELPALANEIYLDHEKYAAYTLWVSGLTFLLRGIGQYYRIHRRTYESLVLGSAVAAAIFLSLTGHRGAQLVYVAGVGPRGHLVLTADQEHTHGGSTAEKDHQAPAADTGAAPHAHAVPGQAPKPDPHAGHDMGAMDQATGSGKAQAGPGLQQQHATAHPAGDKPAREGTAGHDAMPGMQHPAPQKPGSGHAGMDHTVQAAKGKARDHSSGMDHTRKSSADSKQPAPDHGTMGHGSTQPPASQPAAGHQAGRDHGAMPAAGTHQQMGPAAGPGIQTDRYGRPLIDPTQPYDNNPAREQAQGHPKGH